MVSPRVPPHHYLRRYINKTIPKNGAIFMPVYIAVIFRTCSPRQKSLRIHSRAKGATTRPNKFRAPEVSQSWFIDLRQPPSQAARGHDEPTSSTIHARYLRRRGHVDTTHRPKGEGIMRQARRQAGEQASKKAGKRAGTQAGRPAGVPQQQNRPSRPARAATRNHLCCKNHHTTAAVAGARQQHPLSRRLEGRPRRSPKSSLVLLDTADSKCSQRFDPSPLSRDAALALQVWWLFKVPPEYVSVDSPPPPRPPPQPL